MTLATPQALNRMVPRTLLNSWQRWSLWGLLAVLVVGMLATLVWLAGRHEISQVQAQLDRDANDAVVEMRATLARHVQTLQAVHLLHPQPADWQRAAGDLLRERREWLRVQVLDTSARVLAEVETPYRMQPFARLQRGMLEQEVSQTCAAARKLGSVSYAGSYFLPQSNGQGIEAMDLCVPVMQDGRATQYLVATYSLPDMLAEMIGQQLLRGKEVSFTETDGTRLAMHGQTVRRNNRVFSSQQLLDLPGVTLMLRMEGWRAAPDLFPNVLTALVTGMSIALVTVLVLLVKDVRRRMRAERDLADAFAFRKAMEDSLVTGLRARDLEGRITYVNPAFCEMVGYDARELVGSGTPAPYWPPDKVQEYTERQTTRLAARNVPPRQGTESVYMRKNGELFAVMIYEAPLINLQGVQTGWMGAILDVSEQRRVEELSRASQERLQATARLATVGEMASTLSHELNQPLAAIASYATGSLNLLRVDASDAASLELAMRRIAGEAERAGKVIKSVHDFVRRRERMREPVAPRLLVEAIMPLVTLQARKLQVRVMVQFEEPLPQVLCDRTMVEQVLLNLARNAMQSMDHADSAVRTLVLRVARAPVDGRRWLEFSVADLGSGIPPEVAERLFTPFFSTRQEGMGLGLAMCRTVVEQHGGRLTFGPNTPRGTIFRFTLPVQAEATRPHVPAPGEAALAGGNGPTT
ncbi:MAG: PAS domain S-box protein [Burkholderiales bacterium]|nr:PAS domain S-box protein [Burkholderiales bacterium]